MGCLDTFTEKKDMISLEPHWLSFEEKIKIFNSTNLIMSPLSSAFVNIIFCPLDTKIIVLENSARSQDVFLIGLASFYNLNYVNVIGKDEKVGDPHLSAFCDMAEVERALSE